MGDFFGPVFWLIVALGILVTFHEFGHFWVARRCGVKVLRFSVGFGQPLWKRIGRDGCEYVIAWIPLGGYVKMLDERERPVPPDQRHLSFNSKKLWQRNAIIAAGPIFNLIFALFAFWLMFVIGVADVRPLLGEPNGIAAEAGFEEGDLITAVDGKKTLTWSDASIALLLHAYDRERVPVTVENINGRTQQRAIDLARLGDDFDETRITDEIGLSFYTIDIPPRIGEFAQDSAAEAAGLASDDLITAIDGVPMQTMRDVRDALPSALDEIRSLTITVQRDGSDRNFQVTPRWSDDAKRPLIGFSAARPELTAEQEKQAQRAVVTRRYGPIEAIGPAFNESVQSLVTVAKFIGRLITLDASPKNLQSFIGIGLIADQAAKSGTEVFIRLLGFLSLNLALLNFLPIPMLDGGHLFYNLVEWVKGSPVSDRVQLAGQYVGLVLLIGLMGLALSNDILRLVS